MNGTLMTSLTSNVKILQIRMWNTCRDGKGVELPVHILLIKMPAQENH